MRVNAKQERPQIRTFEQLLRRYDLEAIAAIKVATENTTMGLNKTNVTLEQFVIATMGTLENMQNQIDGNISTWFYNGTPTLENAPTVEWSSVEERDAHLGDLYYDKDTGYGYRFSSVEGTYEWIKLTDNDVVEALAIANAAQDTADGKRRVFTDIPSPPYDKGDLWFKDSEIFICNAAKAEGEKYESDDFGIATKYTDDTKANEVASDLAKNYSTTSEMKSEISKSANEIKLTMAATYTTIEKFSEEITALENQYTMVSTKADGIQTTVSSHTTQLNSLGVRVENAESSITQQAREIGLKVNADGIITAINLSKETVKINAKYIDLEGAVTFSSFDEATQTLINDSTYSVAGSMTGISGTATVEIYKNGVLCTESLYLNITYLDGSGGTTWKSSSNGGAVSAGKKTWTYTSVRAYKIEVYTSSAKTKFLCGCILSYGSKGADGTDGEAGSRGTGTYKVTTAPASYSTATGGFTPTYRIALSTVKTQSGATEILVGDILEYSYYHYPVGYVDSSYVYLGARTSIRGATGAAGADGADGKAGADGIGVSSIVEQYYLSSSSSSQTGDSWSTTCPAWKSGYYIWTRSYITWSDGTTTTTTPVLANAINSANTNANTAVSTANTANDTAADALTAANTASSNASSALSTANTASTNATSALNRATYHYGTCSTAAGTAAKAVTLSGFSLYTGAMVSVYFSNANTASSPTLNVNSTGAKSIRVNNAAITSKYYWRAKDTVTFVYNGTYWVMADTSANSLLASWCADNDKTLIDGGKIYASEAFLQNIFSKNITATGSITGAYIYGAYGEFTKGFRVNIPYDEVLGEYFVMNLEDSEFSMYMDTQDDMGACKISLSPYSGIDITSFQPIYISSSRGVFVNGEFTASDVCTSAGVSLTELNSNKANKNWNKIYAGGAVSSVTLDLSGQSEVLVELYQNSSNRFLLATTLMSISDYERCNYIDVFYAGDTSYYARLEKTAGSANCVCKISTNYYVRILAR